MTNEDYMRIAIDAAKTSVKLDGQPYGAVLVSNGEIIAVGKNEVVSKKSNFEHAEKQVIDEFNKKNIKSDDLTLISTCEPCLNCFALAIKSGVKKFIYGSSIETAVAFGSGDIAFSIENLKNNFEFESVGGILKEECDKILDNYYFKRRIVTYSSGTEEEIYWMKKALEIGERGMIEKEELPIGIILVAGDEILSESCTLTYTMNSPITHGDFMALFNAKREVYSPDCGRPLVLYSSLEPHILGFGAAIKCKVDKVVFGLEAIPDGGSCYLPNMVGIKERLPLVVGGVCRDEQYELMKKFLETHDPNRVGYAYVQQLVRTYKKERI